MDQLPALLTLDPSSLIPGPKGDKGDPGEGGLPYIADLKLFMDARYGAGQWSKRTAPGQGTDIGPALVDACNFLRTNYGRGTISITPGSWRAATAPTPAQWSGISVRGQGSMASQVVWDAATGSPFAVSGAGGYTGGGVSGLAIMLEDGYPLSTAYGINLGGDSVHQPDQLMFSDLYITALGNSYWSVGMQAYGNARVSPQGMRIADLTNIQVFRCRSYGFYLSNVVQWSGRNLGCYAGQGGGNTLALLGGSTHVDLALVNATLQISGVGSNVRVNGQVYS